MDNEQLEKELSNNLHSIKGALTLASSSIEGVDAQAILNCTRAYNETVKTLLEVRKNGGGEVTKSNPSLPNPKAGILQINFNDIIKKDTVLETPIIDINEVSNG